MEEGSLRCDANVSMRPAGQQAFGTKAEVKNVNSFRYLQKALEFEIARQTSLLSSGGRVKQETRLWNSETGETASMRSKDEAHDYRYFPEPDLPPLVVDAARVERIRGTLPELPEAKVARFVAAHGLSDYDADVLVRLLPGGADYFEALVNAGAPAKAASNWIQGEVRRKLKEAGDENVAASAIPADRLAELIALAEKGVVSSSGAKQAFETMWATGDRAETVIAREGLAQIGDESALAAIVATVVEQNVDAIAQYKAGKASAFGYLVGQVMKASKGKANPQVAGELLRKAIGT
jgi:aspartyl-tRNA(Asn)/glutamyl-tRNA(Gln) amidotransferase subunit B